MKKITTESTIEELSVAETKNVTLGIVCAIGFLISSIITFIVSIKPIFVSQKTQSTAPILANEEKIVISNDNSLIFSALCGILIVIVLFVLFLFIFKIFSTNFPHTTSEFFKFYNENVISTKVLAYYYRNTNCLFNDFIPETLKNEDFKFEDVCEKAIVHENNVYLVCPVCGNPIVNQDNCKEHLKLVISQKENINSEKEREETLKLKSELSKILKNYEDEKRLY